MISESNAKVIRSLHHKKYRELHNKFIIEGEKSIMDMLAHEYTSAIAIYCSPACYKRHQAILDKFNPIVHLEDEKSLSKISGLDSTPEMIMVCELPRKHSIDPNLFKSGLHLYLDHIQDPGNMGTILRTAEWFGVKSVGLSNGCTDIYSPKVIQSSMGSFSRLTIWKGNLDSIGEMNQIHVYGADLRGQNMYHIHFNAFGILVIGSEGKGMSDEVKAQVHQLIKIPAYSDKIDSLNAATATAIILSEWCRQLSL